MFGSRTSRIRRARLVPIALTTAALSSAVLGASVTGTLSGFAASITNNANTASSGSLVMQETGPSGTVCLSSSGTNNSFASCNGINKYGGDGSVFIPGRKHDTVVSFANTGSIEVTSFKLAADTCSRTYLDGSSSGTASNSSNLCGSLQLTLDCAPVSGQSVGTSANVFTGATLASIAGSTTTLPTSCVPQSNSRNSVQFTFSVKMPDGQDNTVQGQQVSQNLTWTFTGA